MYHAASHARYTCDQTIGDASKMYITKCDVGRRVFRERAAKGEREREPILIHWGDLWDKREVRKAKRERKRKKTSSTVDAAYILYRGRSIRIKEGANGKWRLLVSI